MIKTDLVDSGWIGSAEAASLLGVSRVTLNRWAANGEVPIAFESPGKTGIRLFDRSEIEDLAATAAKATVRKYHKGPHRKGKPGPGDVPLAGLDVQHDGDKLKTA